MANPENFDAAAPLDIPQIIDKFLSADPVSYFPVDFVGNNAVDWRFIEYTVDSAVYDQVVKAGRDPTKNFALIQQLTKEVESQIPNLEQILGERKTMADRLNARIELRQA